MASFLSRTLGAATRGPLSRGLAHKSVQKTAPVVAAVSPKQTTKPNASKPAEAAKGLSLTPAPAPWRAPPRPEVVCPKVDSLAGPSSADFYDISGQLSVNLRVGIDPKTPQYVAHLPANLESVGEADVAWLSYTTTPPNLLVPFPKGTTGRFYFSVAESKLGSELRFRILKTPGDWEAGSDLKGANGMTWNIPFTWMHSRSGLHGLAKLLVKEGLVSSQTMDQVKSLHNNELWKTQSVERNVIVHSLNQKFPLDLHSPNQTAWLNSEDGQIQSISLEGLFAMYNPLPPVEGKPYQEWIPRFRGQAVCQFEISKLEEHEDVPTVVLRVMHLAYSRHTGSSAKGLKNIPKPVEGQLVQWPTSKTRRPGPVTWNHTSPVGAALLIMLSGEKPTLQDSRRRIKQRMEEQTFQDFDYA